MGNKSILILVVDDEPRNLQLAGKVVSDNGFDVAMAQNGCQALNFVKKNQPDLILLDIMMPDLDGYEVCRRLKKNPEYRHIPVIFLTAKNATVDVVRGFEAGGVDYIPKPWQSPELLARIRTHLELKLLRSLFPMCASCKRIRDDEGYWNQVDSYLEAYTDMSFTHSICDDCMEDLYSDADWFRQEKAPAPAPAPVAAGDNGIHFENFADTGWPERKIL
ncbi:MAG TPA: response regulator [Desulfobacteraceae bacterium]|nr:response regulator [Desulfobacteraceae bacterium]